MAGGFSEKKRFQGRRTWQWVPVAGREEKGNGTGSVNSQGGSWAGSSAGPNRFREAQFYIFISFPFSAFLFLS
jgi:hypothetical protein